MRFLIFNFVLQSSEKSCQFGWLFFFGYINRMSKFKKGNKLAEKWTEKKALELGDELLTWISNNRKDRIFFSYFLTVEKGLYAHIVRYLCEKFDSFNDIIEQAKEIQKNKLIKLGVEDKLNGSMTKFTLINNHGMSERVENHNINEKVELSPEDRKRRLEELRKKLSK